MITSIASWAENAFFWGGGVFWVLGHVVVLSMAVLLIASPRRAARLITGTRRTLLAVAGLMMIQAIATDVIVLLMLSQVVKRQMEQW